MFESLFEKLQAVMSQNCSWSVACRGEPVAGLPGLRATGHTECPLDQILTPVPYVHWKDGLG